MTCYPRPHLSTSWCRTSQTQCLPHAQVHTYAVPNTYGNIDSNGNGDAGPRQCAILAYTALAHTSLHPTTAPRRLGAHLVHGFTHFAAAPTLPVTPPSCSTTTCAATTICSRQVPHLAVGRSTVGHGWSKRVRLLAPFACSLRPWATDIIPDLTPVHPRPASMH